MKLELRPKQGTCRKGFGSQEARNARARDAHGQHGRLTLVRVSVPREQVPGPTVQPRAVPGTLLTSGSTCRADGLFGLWLTPSPLPRVLSSRTAQGTDHRALECVPGVLQPCWLPFPSR